MFQKPKTFPWSTSHRELPFHAKFNSKIKGPKTQASDLSSHSLWPMLRRQFANRSANLLVYRDREPLGGAQQRHRAVFHRTESPGIVDRRKFWSHAAHRLWMSSQLSSRSGNSSVITRGIGNPCADLQRSRETNERIRKINFQGIVTWSFSRILNMNFSTYFLNKYSTKCYIEIKKPWFNFDSYHFFIIAINILCF